MVNTKRVLYVLFYTSLILCIQGSTDDSKNNVNQPPISNPFININCCNDNSVNKAPTDVERIQNEWKKDTELLKKMKIAKYEEEQIEKKLSVKECKKEENEDIPAYGETYQRLLHIKEELGFTDDTPDQHIIETLKLNINDSKREEILQLWKQYGKDMKKTYYANFFPYKIMELCAAEFPDKESTGRLIKRECQESLKAFYYNQDVKSANIAFQQCHGVLKPDSNTMKKLHNFLIKKCRDAITSFNFNQNEITAATLLQICENILHPDNNIRKAMRNAQKLLDQKKKDKFEEELDNNVKHILGQNLADETDETKSTVDTEELEDADLNLNETNSVIRTDEHEEEILMADQNYDETNDVTLNDAVDQKQMYLGTVALNESKMKKIDNYINNSKTGRSCMTSLKKFKDQVDKNPKRKDNVFNLLGLIFITKQIVFLSKDFFSNNTEADNFGEFSLSKTAAFDIFQLLPDIFLFIYQPISNLYRESTKSRLVLDWSLYILILHFSFISNFGSAGIPTLISSSVLFLVSLLNVLSQNSGIICKNLYDRINRQKSAIKIFGSNILVNTLMFFFLEDKYEIFANLWNFLVYIIFLFFYIKKNGVSWEKIESYAAEQINKV